MKTSVPLIVVKSTPGLTLQEARNARAHAWRFIFDCYEAKKKGGPETAPNNAERSSYAIGATGNCNR